MKGLKVYMDQQRALQTAPANITLSLDPAG